VSRGRLPGIEGLRAMAAGAVLMHHVWAYNGDERLGFGGTTGGVFLNLALGVTLFFALSGFLLYRPFALAIARDQPLPSVRGYLRNRALRILPAYWVILLIVSLAGYAYVRGPDGSIQFGTLKPLELVTAALLVQDYRPDTLLLGIGPAWSLAVEAVFYLLLPLLGLGAARLARRASTRSRRAFVALLPPLGLLVLGLAGKLVAGTVLGASPGAGYETDWHSVVERSFLAQADLFSFGMIAAVGHGEFSDGTLRLPRHWRAGALAIAVAIAVPCALSFGQGQLSYLPQNTAVALAAALLVAVVAYPDPRGGTAFAGRILDTRIPVAVGLVSYSVFLWHEPLIRLLADAGVMRPGWSGLAFDLVVTAALTGVLATLTYRWVERPALRRKRRPPAVDEALDAAQMEAAP
jgi:peptidoglycan/LPS O-acetylase OafA/YrhL